MSRSYHIQTAHKRVFSGLNHLAHDKDALLHRRYDATLITVSHNPGTLRRYCPRGAVVYGGNLASYNGMEEASDAHHRLQLLAA